tara:strand:+ start:31 stop:462 length:432 start_codon:yes stop_codon:yes gene_type:complete
VAEEIEKTPTGDVALNKPTSGTYGEKADLNRLKSALPPMEQQQRPSQQPSPMRSPSGQVPQRPMGRPTNAPLNLPAGITAPTNRPEVPLNTPLSQGPVMPQRNPAADKQRLAILEALSTHPEVSQETREWAALVAEYLISGRG